MSDEHVHWTMCGQLLLGSGGDTYDPLCVLPIGHAGRCKSTAAVDQHRISVEDLSLAVERMTAHDSIATVERVYDRTPSGAFQCPFPDCDFVRRDAEAMWRHVHGIGRKL